MILITTIIFRRNLIDSISRIWVKRKRKIWFKKSEIECPLREADSDRKVPWKIWRKKIWRFWKKMYVWKSKLKNWGNKKKIWSKLSKKIRLINSANLLIITEIFLITKENLREWRKFRKIAKSSLNLSCL